MIQIWRKGYRISGGQSDATLLGEYNAETFKDAVLMLIKEREKMPQDYYAIHESKGIFTDWGCRLFDNESDARKKFG